MKKGYLSEYFLGIGAKRLTSVEVDPEKSNQHEFQGVHELKEILGAPSDKVKFKAKYLYCGEEEPVTTEAFATWSDVRRNQPSRSPEFHLYYPAQVEELIYLADPGDLLIVCMARDGGLLIIIIRAGTTSEKQLMWLFGLREEDLFQSVIRDFDSDDTLIGYAAKWVIEYLGIEITDTADDLIEQLVKKFPDGFPSTREFSAFARNNIQTISPVKDPDAAMLAWMDMEETLFRTLERQIVKDRISDGFSEVDDFISFSLSVHNRRKSRAGLAMENHLEQIFKDHSIRYSRGKKTEGKKKPDFIFPCIDDYRNENFPVERLTMLGVKTSCKDRWRQILVEAELINEKHLFTHEPGISEDQTKEMQGEGVSLVLPCELHSTYSNTQKGWLISLGEFIELVKIRQ